MAGQDNSRWIATVLRDVLMEPRRGLQNVIDLLGPVHVRLQAVTEYGCAESATGEVSSDVRIDVVAADTKPAIAAVPVSPMDENQQRPSLACGSKQIQPVFVRTRGLIVTIGEVAEYSVLGQPSTAIQERQADSIDDFRTCGTG